MLWDPNGFRLQGSGFRVFRMFLSRFVGLGLRSYCPSHVVRREGVILEFCGTHPWHLFVLLGMADVYQQGFSIRCPEHESPHKPY